MDNSIFVSENFIVKYSNIQKSLVKYELLDISAKVIPHIDISYFAEPTLHCRLITPEKDTLLINAFKYQDFERSFRGKEILHSVGNLYWRIRYTPTQVGTYQLLFEVHSGENKFLSDEIYFVVDISENLGFLRVDSTCFHLKFDCGSTYVANGIGLAWANSENITYDYEAYFSQIEKNGCNYTRIWLVEWNIPLEWTPGKTTHGDVHGLGVYSLENSWRLDFILKEAEKRGIYLVLCLGSYGDLMDDEQNLWNENRWLDNPYNILNGGVCTSPEEFWTNPDAKNFYKRKLQYIIDRWGYSTNILAFELWNEVDAPLIWMNEMSQYLKGIDPNKHLITTSTGFDINEKDKIDRSSVWNLQCIDITQSHIYGVNGNLKNLAKAVHEDCRTMIETYKKPHLIGEFGIDFSKDDNHYDTLGEGIQIHNAIWASLMSGAIGVSITHWKEYVNSKGLYSHYKSISEYIDSFQKDTTSFDDMLTISDIEYSCLREVRIYPEIYWGQSSAQSISIDAEGNPSSPVSQYVYSQNFRSEPYYSSHNYQIYNSHKGNLIIGIDQVSQNANLKIYENGILVWEHSFPSRRKDKKWYTRKFSSKYNTYTYFYNKEFTVPLSKGEKTIRIENTGSDWLKIKYLEFPNRTCKEPQIFGISSSNESIGMVQNITNNWYNQYYGFKKDTINDLKFKVNNLPNGEYTIKYWNTVAPSVITTADYTNKNNYIELYVNKITTDIAFHILKKTD